MITLYTFGPYFGSPDGSPFVIKAMLLLKLADLPFREDRHGYGKAPKGKLPYIDDDGTRVADSTFIRFHIEAKYGIDFDVGLTPEARATSWAVEKMLEDHLYWAVVDARWGDRDNFAKGPARFFDAIPMPVRPLLAQAIRRKTVKRIKAQGLGLHSRGDIERLAIRDIEAVAAILGDKPYLMGDRPCAADAALFGVLNASLASVFDTPIRTAAERCENLVAYDARLKARFFPASA